MLLFPTFQGTRLAKKRKLSVFETDLETVRNKLSEGTFTVIDNVGRGAFWKSYQAIQTDDAVITNYIRCRYCLKIDKYDTKAIGTKHLSTHASKCSSPVETIDTWIPKHITITAEEKKMLSQAAAIFCSMDIRPFLAVEGDGFIKLMTALSQIAAKYGRLDEVNIKRILPTRQTVILLN